MKVSVTHKSINFLYSPLYFYFHFPSCLSHHDEKNWRPRDMRVFIENTLTCVTLWCQWLQCQIISISMVVWLCLTIKCERKNVAKIYLCYFPLTVQLVGCVGALSKRILSIELNALHFWSEYIFCATTSVFNWAFTLSSSWAAPQQCPPKSSLGPLSVGDS